MTDPGRCPECWGRLSPDPGLPRGVMVCPSCNTDVDTREADA